MEHERQEAVFCQTIGLLRLSAILPISGSHGQLENGRRRLPAVLSTFERPNPMRPDDKSENASLIINLGINW